MPSRSSKPKDHDFTTVALRVVEQAIGEKWDGSPLPDKRAGKNPAAVAPGKLGGSVATKTVSYSEESSSAMGKITPALALLRDTSWGVWPLRCLDWSYNRAAVIQQPIRDMRR
jgi:hypothetical protein